MQPCNKKGVNFLLVIFVTSSLLFKGNNCVEIATDWESELFSQEDGTPLTSTASERQVLGALPIEAFDLTGREGREFLRQHVFRLYITPLDPTRRRIIRLPRVAFPDSSVFLRRVKKTSRDPRPMPLEMRHESS